MQIRTLSDPETIRRAYAGELWPDELFAVFSQMERVFPGRQVRRAGPVRPMPRAAHGLEGFIFTSGSRTVDLYDYVSLNRIVGLLVLKDGETLLERYESGMTAATRWASMSMAKSITSTLAGMALQDGSLRDLDDPLTDYLPELASGAYADVTVRQLLRMSTGVAWNESHVDPTSERRQVLELQFTQHPGLITAFMSQLPKLAPAGTRWNYNTGETHLLGALLHAATGRWLADELADRIWSVAGMEADASWWLESPDGLEVAGTGLSATLRDYARFALFLLEGAGATLPPGWLGEAGAGFKIEDQAVSYGYMWWPVATGGFSARGVFGQRIHINPARGLVVVMLSARSKPMTSEVVNDNDFFGALARAL